MGFLDKTAMRTAYRRLVSAGVAPSGETPLDFDTAAMPGRTAGASILMLTDQALYAGFMGRPGGRRLPLDSVALIDTASPRPHAVQFTVFDTDGDPFGRWLFDPARDSFTLAMQNLSRGAPGLPGITTPVEELLGNPVMAGVPARLLQLLDPTAGSDIRINHVAMLLSYDDGVAVLTAPGGIVWRRKWDDIGVTAWKEDMKVAGRATRMLLELGSFDGARALVALPPMALWPSDDRTTDEFLMHPSVEPHLHLHQVTDGDRAGALLIA